MLRPIALIISTNETALRNHRRTDYGDLSLDLP